jgi:hypothetical protein
MAFNLYGGAPIGRPGPARGLQIPLRMTYVGSSSHGILHGIEGELHFAGKVASAVVSCTKVHFGGGANLATIARSMETTAALFAPLSREAIRYIDENRGKDDLNFTLTLRVKWQSAEEVPPPAGGRVGYKLDPLSWSEQSPNWEPMPSSTWKRCLEQMEYELREVIEIPKLPFSSDPALAEALARLKSAEGHASDGDWRDVSTNCRVAFESLSRYEAPGRDNTKRGFELLLARAYPDSWHAPRRERMNALIQELREFCGYFGPHIDVPPVHPTRAEALLALNTTASLLAALGRALSDAESERGTVKAPVSSSAA